jgi:microcystin degradation protein MlrC
MRVGILALFHESNTFIRTPTTRADFANCVLLSGSAIQDHFAQSHHEVGGFFEGLNSAGIEPVPVFATVALPGGAIAADAFESLLKQMFAELTDAGNLDALLVAAHGAAVSEQFRDADGEWLTRLRAAVGPRVPIVCTLDPHANLSQRMIAACDATVAYRTNPHLDQRERGVEAANLLARMLRKEVRPSQAAAFPALAINIERQLTAASPCRELYALADDIRRRPGVLSASIVLGFPYADVAEMGSSIIVVTDNNAALAEQLAAELAQHLFTARANFKGQFLSIDDALDQALALDGPVCLLDMGDNVGGGGPGDGTFLARAIHDRKLARACVCICDPQSVAAAEQAGIEHSVRLQIGGKSDTLHGSPLDTRVQVRSLHTGRFTELAPRHGGNSEFDMGRSAVVETERGLTLLLTSRRTPPFSLGALTSCGIDPSRFRLIVAKGVNAPVAAYSPVCPHFLRVNTPGVTCADMTAFDYQHRRRPLYPFEAQ